MSLRVRFAVLTTAGLIAAGYTAALAFEPLCSVFRSTRHYSSRAAERTTPAPASETPTALAAHH
jgi:hypothetical protein